MSRNAYAVAFVLAGGLIVTPAWAGVIAQWNFNSLTPDASTGTGTTAPAVGQGTALLVGGATASFATGCTNDPAAEDNSGWNTASYPAQGTSNKTAGVQFAVSTAGYSDITIRWDHKVSGTASKYCRLQYSGDGLEFLDLAMPVIAQAVSSRANYFEAQTFSLAGMPGVDDNPNFVFRVVSEFESTALGYGTDGYVTTFATNNYSRSGTIRFDMVTVLGTPIPGANTAPQITRLPDQVLRPGQTSPPLPFTVSDAEEDPSGLMVQASSSDPAVVPEANLALTGAGSSRTLTLTAGDQPGVANITLVVSDSGGKSAASSFAVTVLPVNTPPMISSIPGTNTLMNTAGGPIGFTVGDAETAADALLVCANSDNPALLPNDPAHLALGGSGSNRTLTLTPAAGQVGVAPVTVTVSDGACLAACRLALVVRPAPSVLLYEPFCYPDGSVVTNSGLLWATRSGTAGQCQVTNGQLQVTASQTEDVVVPLPGGPYFRTDTTVLYAGFRVRFLSLPKALPAYFAHFGGGSTLRGRIYAATTNAAPGGFQLLAANGSDAAVAFPRDLAIDTPYTVVLRYDLEAAATTLWVDPVAEGDLCALAEDPQTAVSISAFGFRQDSSLGAVLLVSELRVGLSFDAVLPAAGSPPARLGWEVRGRDLVLRWDDPASVLQSASDSSGPFGEVAGAASPFTVPLGEGSRFFRLAAP